jgi:hypothetical protein
MCSCGGCHAHVIIASMQQGKFIPDCGDYDYSAAYDGDSEVEVDEYYGGLIMDDYYDYEPEPKRITLSDAKSMGVRLSYLSPAHSEPTSKLRDEELATITPPVLQENRINPTYPKIKLFLRSEVVALSQRKKNGEVIGPQPRPQDGPKRKGKVMFFSLSSQLWLTLHTDDLKSGGCEEVWLDFLRIGGIGAPV